ncbi:MULTISPECIES: LacI family DNA-binding transcriptional regulator [Metabacillus]|uniref:Transcriptional regulator n=2 Tax=Metabacillus TaxID=2675233 RepID=A0A179T668_9BACI|nr:MULTISPECIES: LacI family DNA-binding transcriptional regulator [Metabacillus]OAS89271.1 transcriptional regulator [Metabacillus litoralis]QNF28784.1 LacI family DNA-binding transcriptional regulator [Metabacillus sp. KUDC1714]
MKQPTIYDVAKEAGVAISTVSKVLNNTGSIGAKTRKKVEETMQKLNYQPSVAASVKKRIQTIGLLIPNIADPFMAEIARTIEDHGRKFGFSLMICSTDNDLDKEIEYVSILKQKYIDGIIIATGLKNTVALKELINSEIPVALLAREVPSLAVNTVVVNDFLGAFEATSYLIKLGHQKIAMVTEDIYFPVTKSRLDGYKQALEQAGINYNENLVTINNTSFTDALDSTVKLLNLPEPPTAIFASTEPLAIGAMQGARESGFDIPKDISIVGFDNSILAEMCYPQLTTVSQPIQEMGKKIIELLVEEIKDPKKLKQRIVMSPELVIRRTASEMNN